MNTSMRRKTSFLGGFGLAVLAMAALAVSSYGQTVDLGLGAFANEKGPILIAVDAALVNQDLKSPYVMVDLPAN